MKTKKQKKTVSVMTPERLRKIQLQAINDTMDEDPEITENEREEFLSIYGFGK